MAFHSEEESRFHNHPVLAALPSLYPKAHGNSQEVREGEGRASTVLFCFLNSPHILGSFRELWGKLKVVFSYRNVEFTGIEDTLYVSVLTRHPDFWEDSWCCPVILTLVELTAEF